MELHVHLMRHGEVTSHAGNVAVTPRGLEMARRRGRRLAEDVAVGEDVYFLHSRALRTCQTAEAVRSGMAEALAERGIRDVKLRPPVEEPALRNPDLYLAGVRVEFVTTPQALAEQVAGLGMSAADLGAIPFWPDFWTSDDEIGLWVSHPDPPGEDALAVARRLRAYLTSLSLAPARGPRRYVCVTHSGPMRAFLRTYVLGKDPGEPDFCETIDMCCRVGESMRVQYRGKEAWLRAPHP